MFEVIFRKLGKELIHLFIWGIFFFSSILCIPSVNNTNILCEYSHVWV